MSALQKIRDAGFDVSLDGDALEISPASELTQSQRDFLKSHRAEIIGELQAENNNPLLVTVWTPAGNPIQVQAKDAEHAAFLIWANPKPKEKV